MSSIIKFLEEDFQTIILRSKFSKNTFQYKFFRKEFFKKKILKYMIYFKTNFLKQIFQNKFSITY